MIPHDWKRVPIYDLAPLQRGFDLPTHRIQPGRHPVVYSNGVLQHHSLAMVKGPGVATGRSGTIGRVHFLEDDYWPHNTSLWVTSFRGNDPKFVYYLYTHINFARFISGSGVPTLNRNDVHRYVVAMPLPPEQRAIAEVLSDVDALLEALDRLIAKKRDLKQTAMQRILAGQTRLPGFSGKCRAIQFGEIVSIRNQKVLPATAGIDTLCVELDQIGQGSGKLLQYTTVQNSTSSKYRFFSGDVLFGRLRSYLRKFWHADRDGICSTEIWPLMTDLRQANAGFVHAVVQSDLFIDAAGISYGTHMPRADWGVIGKLEIRLPPLDEQHAIAVVLSDMGAEIAALEARRDKTRDLKRAMMQELLTGKTRLVKLEADHA